MLKKGDYVLASKWSDGDPMDPWAIGFYDREVDGRIMVIDNYGNQLRPAGFRRAKKISREVGTYMLAHVGDITLSGRSVFSWALNLIYVPLKHDNLTRAIGALLEDGATYKELTDLVDKIVLNWAIDKTEGNKRAAATMLKMNRVTLYNKLKKL